MCTCRSRRSVFSALRGKYNCTRLNTCSWYNTLVVIPADQQIAHFTTTPFDIPENDHVIVPCTHETSSDSSFVTCGPSTKYHHNDGFSSADAVNHWCQNPWCDVYGRYHKLEILGDGSWCLCCCVHGAQFTQYGGLLWYCRCCRCRST